MLSGRGRHLLYSGFLSTSAAAALRAELRALGLSDAQLVLELASRDTRENAVESARIAAASRWRSLLLVTGAAHAKRAVGCFREAGLAPDLYPVAFEADGSQRPPRWGHEARRQALAALHEWAGRVVYAALGYAR
nr:YdcF family protein [Anaeromyxobacter diazotrophicus]